MGIPWITESTQGEMLEKRVANKAPFLNPLLRTFMSILNRIRYFTQRGKRQKLLNKYGFYATIETYNDLSIWTNSPFGVEMTPRHQTTASHIHTMLDCPFLIKPRYKNQTEYSCQLCLPISINSSYDVYNIELKDLITLLENLSADWQDTPLVEGYHYPCECMEWTKHIFSSPND